MGGPRVTEEAKKLIVDIWLEARDQGKEITAFQVKQGAEQRVKSDKNLKNVRIPKLRKVQLILAAAYDNLRKAEQLEVMPDSPWSLGSFDIPAEAVPAALRIWKLSLIAEKTLGINEDGSFITGTSPISNREMKWAVRLNGLIKNTSNLLRWSRAYAARERACEATGLSARDTSDLDSALTMRNWEWATLQLLLHLLQERKYNVNLSKPSIRPNMEALEFSKNDDLSLQDTARHLEISFYETDPWGLSLDIDAELPDLEKLRFSDEDMWVYSFWLLYMRKGTKWVGLSSKERLGIIRRLREWVGEHAWSKRTAMLPMGGLVAAKMITEEVSLKPGELLKTVGYLD